MNNITVCKRCVMDTTAPDITFSDEGFCNFCTDFIEIHKDYEIRINENISDREHFIDKIKADGKGKKYDCIVGVSGGVDSSYVLYLAVKSGLRPLAVHLDNGWNSELAVHNITELVNSLNVDLYTHVIDWAENKDMQKSFFKANVIDIEMLMDNAMLAINYDMAKKHRIKYILGGTNIATEGLAMPEGWNHFKFDAKNIRSIHKRFGSKKISTHPLISSTQYIIYEFFKKIKWHSFLDYFEYKKDDALEVLKSEVNYKPYPYKHYESVFTRFYQGYILPNKFGVDKRKLHLATLVASNQMDREEAIRLLSDNPYPDASQLESDKEFVLKKLDFTEEEFDSYMNAPEILHSEYKTEEKLWNFFKSVKRKLYR